MNSVDSESPKVPRLVSDFRRLLFSASIGAVSIIVAEGLYIGAAGGTTFSSSDVTVETTLIRRKITGHTLLAFAFNTVVIAC